MNLEGTAAERTDQTLNAPYKPGGAKGLTLQAGSTSLDLQAMQFVSDVGGNKASCHALSTNAVVKVVKAHQHPS